MSKEINALSKILWTDKKRFAGLKRIFWVFPTSFTRYSLNEKAFILKTGLLNIKEEQVLLYRIVDISLRKTFIDSIFKTGSLIILSDDKTIPNLKVQKIKHPEKLRHQLNEFIEIARKRNMVFSREFIDHEEDLEGMSDQLEDFPEGIDS